MADITRLLAENNISIEALIQKGSATDGSAEIVILTHRVVEKSANKAIAAIEALDSVAGKVVRLRMEELNG
ncbi:homoserine dehydrogenase [compost metagenome]